jgi:hypothetical protein
LSDKNNVGDISTEALKTCSGKRKAYPINHAEKTGYLYAEG